MDDMWAWWIAGFLCGAGTALLGVGLFIQAVVR